MPKVLKQLISALMVLVFAGTMTLAQDSKPLLSNGDFAAVENGQAKDWALKAGQSIETDGDNHFLRLVSSKPGENVLVYRSLKVQPEHKAYELSYKVRYDGIKPGKKQWFDGRIMMNFKSADGKTVGTPSPPTFKGSSKEWKTRTQQFLVPEGADTLELMFTLFQVEAGTLEFDDIKLAPVDPAPVKAAVDAAAAKKAEDVASRAARVKPGAPVATAEQMPKELRVAGNKIVDSDGKEVWLQGMSIASMSWSAGGEQIIKSCEIALDDWKANCIRLAVTEDFWAGTGAYQADGGAGYRQLVDDAVNICAARGKYLVIDLHRFRAPQQKHADFWVSVAEKYKNHPAVIFELFNEPHDVTWEVWKNGGKVGEKRIEHAPGEDPAVENNAKLATFETVGMQKLVDVIRETGAKNPIIAGGLDWSYDISGVLKGFALDDPKGNGIIYSTHVYPWKRRWQEKFVAVAEKHPIFVGELGAEPEPMPFIKKEMHEDPYTWSPDMLGLIQKHKMHWTGWCFHPKSSPRIILDWEFTPTPFWGAFVKRALAGEQFEMKKMR